MGRLKVESEKGHANYNHSPTTGAIATGVTPLTVKFVEPRRFTPSLLVIAGLLCLLAGTVTRADHLLPTHQLTCSASFPCPEEIHRRIDFWIQVFKGWGKEMAIFHDSTVPERVYLVLDTGHGCSGKARRRIKANARAIRQSLEKLAADVKAERQVTDRRQRHLLGLFPSGSSREIQRAARKVRCQSGVRDGFLAGLKRFNRYVGMVDHILAENNLPKDIRYLPFVESSYNPAAYSKAGAAGMWQIMPATARSLGLELNAALDERLDPEAATRAAARYLVDATGKLMEASRSRQPGIAQETVNPFVITSYNYGVNGMRRAIHRIGPDYMEVLNRYKSPAFQVAVKNFYASFLAARHVAKNADRYFPRMQSDSGTREIRLVLERATSMDRIKGVFGLSEAELKPLNRPLTRFIWNGWRLIPAGYRLSLPWRSHRWKREIARLSAMTPEKDVPGGGTYIVRKGDTACGIARALRVNCSLLIRANDLGKRALIRVGQRLTIPRKPASAALSVASRRSGAPSSWTVKRGDTACGIARQTGVDCKELIRVNRLGRKARILVGQKLVIPGKDYLAQNPAGLNADNQYIVQKGDAACRVAARFRVSCRDLIRLNQLGSKAIIYPGQKLSIPGFETPATTETAARLAMESGSAGGSAAKQEKAPLAPDNQLVNLLDTLPDLSIRVGSKSGKPAYYIFVEVDESLGHYADWLGIGSSRTLRNLNGLPRGEVLKLGRRLRFPEISPETVARFERMRIEYHQVLSETLKENYHLVGIDNYTVKSGDSLWDMSRRLGFPLWLMYRLNPELRITGLTAGRTIRLPQLTAI